MMSAAVFHFVPTGIEIVLVSGLLVGNCNFYHLRFIFIIFIMYCT